METVKKRRMQRAVSLAEPRKRQISDLIQLASLYQKEELLCELDPSHEHYVDRAAAELAVISSIPVSGVKRVMQIVGIRHNENAWNFLKQSSRLRIFDDVNFTKGWKTVDSNRGGLCLSFLESFVNGSDPKVHEGKLRREKKLGTIALNYTASARHICVTMFLKCVSVISTLCSFFPEGNSFDKLKVIDIVERFFSDSWTSDIRQKQYHMHASRQFGAEGWFMVREIFKVQVQELGYWKARTTNEAEHIGKTFTVNEDDVSSTAHLWCHRLVVEFFGWIYHLSMREEETIPSFVHTVCDVMDKMNENLAEQIGSEKKEYILDGLINSTLTQIQRNAPTMAEVR